MPSLSQRLKAVEPFLSGQKLQAVQQAHALSLLVEAFQAAERVYWAACDAIDPLDFQTRIWAQQARDVAEAAKARLLEVNLG